VAEEKRKSWRQFQQLNFNSKKLSKRAKKAEGATLRHAHKFIVHRWENIRSVRRHVISWLVLIGLLIAGVGIQLNWFQRSYSTDAPAAGGTYAEAALGPLDTLNPIYATTSAESSATKLLFSSLYDYDSTGHLRGDVAKSMKVNAEGTVYTIALRHDAMWHDGTRLTAKDVVFTINTIKNPVTRSTIKGWQGIDVKAVDDFTVTFTLPAINATFSHALTFPILPKHILEDVAPNLLRENSFGQTPTGSGPFRIRLLQIIDITNGRKIVHMSANKEYYRGAPKLSRFQLHVYGTTDAIAMALRTSEVSAAADVAASSVPAVDTGRYNVLARPINNGVYAIFNTRQDILKDKTVRQALQVATNVADIRKSVSPDVPALDLPFINGQVTGTDVPKRPPYDAAKAAAMLEQAGWKKQADGKRAKDGQPLQLRILTLKDSGYEKALEPLAQQWRSIGVTIDAEILDPTDRDVSERLQNRNFDVLLYGLAIGADPDVFAYWHSSQSSQRLLNLSSYADAAADEALSSARSITNPELRNAKYISFAKQWLQDVPAIGLYQPVAYYAYAKTSQSMDPMMHLISSRDRYADVLYWTADRATVYKTP
jgi:peptide/nickel transport system substrate-binding protein